MAQDFGNAVNMLKDMLSSEEGKKNLQNVIGALSGNGEGGNDEVDGRTEPAENSLPVSRNQNFLSAINPDMITRVSSVIQDMQDPNDPRINLISALKPYLRSHRYGHIDNAIKIIQLAKIPNVIKKKM